MSPARVTGDTVLMCGISLFMGTTYMSAWTPFLALGHQSSLPTARPCSRARERWIRGDPALPAWHHAAYNTKEALCFEHCCPSLK